MLSEMNSPKTKQDLIKSINKLKNIQIKIVEPISRREINNVRSEVDRFMGREIIFTSFFSSKES